MTRFGTCTYLSNPLAACLTGCGIITSLLGFLTVSTFTPIAATNYVNDFTKYQISVQNIKCIDSTNMGNYYDIQLPKNTLTTPPIVNQTTIPTIYIVDNIFIRPPYYELHVRATPMIEPIPRNIIYSMRYKFMNQCVQFAELLVSNHIWNGTSAYVYTRRNDSYPFAFPTYDIILPYTIATSIILLGIIILVGACCAGTPGCPLNKWVSGRRIGGGNSRGNSSMWGTV